VHQLLAELADCDWALVEGFKHADLLNIEVWRAETGEAPRYADDPFIVAVATDQPQALPTPTALPVLSLGDAQAVVDFLMGNPSRYDYISPYDTADA
jgi:molybdopterin-guanine dinucleotide biosynthesis protein B